TVVSILWTSVSGLEPNVRFLSRWDPERSPREASQLSPPRSSRGGAGGGLSARRLETSAERREPHPLPPPRKRAGEGNLRRGSMAQQKTRIRSSAPRRLRD